MLVPILLCTFLGIFLDRLFSTSFIVIIFFFLGAAAGFRNIYIFSKGSSKKSYLGSDIDKKLEEIDKGEAGRDKEDIFESIDRIHKKNLNNK